MRDDKDKPSFFDGRFGAADMFTYVWLGTSIAFVIIAVIWVFNNLA